MATALPIFPEFNLRDQSNLAARWEKYLKRFHNLMTAMNITDASRKRALLLHYVGEEVNDLFETLPDTGDDKDFKKAHEALTQYFTPTKNASFEIFKFRNLKQEAHETVDDFHTRLQIASKYCEFGENKDKEIKAQIELGTTSKKLRRYSFRSPALSLTELLNHARTIYETEKQAKGIETTSRDLPVNPDCNHENEDIHKVQSQRPSQRATTSRHQFPRPPANTKSRENFPSQPSKHCFRCGGTWPHISGKCPAEGQRCNICFKYNHFARVCKSRNRRQTENSANAVQSDTENSQYPSQDEDSTDSDEYSFNVHATNIKEQDKQSFYAKLKLGKSTIKFQIDSGSSANIIDESTFAIIHKENPEIQLTKSRKRLFAFGSKTPLPLLGQFQCVLESKKRLAHATIVVVKNATGCLLSGKTSIDLNIVTITVNKVNTKPATFSKLSNHKKLPNRLRPVIAEFDEVFHGVGKLTDVQVHLHIDENVKPVVQPTRRIPFALRQKVEQEIVRLQENDIIEPAQGPTLWVSPIVAFPKPNNPDKLRLCVDMRQANTAILRERHPQPTIEDLLNDLNGARYFSKLDLTAAYHQLELDEQSRYITTFTTHKGLVQYKRLNFGTSSASEIFQSTIQSVFNGISGCRNISDDLIIFGKTQSEHDQTLRTVLQVAKERNLRFGFDKCEFDQRQLEFFGYVFSREGISPSPSKVRAIKQAPIPKNASEVRSFLGMLQYCGRFIPNLAKISAPLRLLTHKDVRWTWTSRQQNAFETLKDLLTTDTVMSYYDPLKQTELHVDASPYGLGAILTQTTPGHDDSKVIAYASRSLTDTESKYSQIEREALAIVFGIEHFHLYLYGHEFTLVTDHKPLELIYQNPRSRPSARLERWCLRLQDYTFQVKYRPGPTNPSDYLSRHPLPEYHSINKSTKPNLADQHVHFVAQNAVPVALSTEQLCKATKQDSTLQALIELLQNNTWHLLATKYSGNTNVDLAELKALRGNRLIIPKQLRTQVIQLAHEGHQGLVKTKKLLREKVWFPGIDNLAAKMIKDCLACQSVGQPAKPAPLNPLPIPLQAWDTVYVDFLGPLPSKDLLLVVIDGRTRFPEVEIVRTTNAKSTINCFNRIFATHGLPRTIVSDNGPPFQSEELRQYMISNGITHRKITPLWPQANAEAETFMKPLTKCLQTAAIENKDWKQELQKFLFIYRATPHCTTKIPPATALFGRNIRTKLPQQEVSVNMRLVNKQINEADAETKLKSKNYADKRRGAKQLNFTVGDQVLVRQRKRNKLTSRFIPKPYEITDIKGTMITARRKDHQITRNCSHFKLFTGNSNSGFSQSDSESDVSVEDAVGQPNTEEVQRREK